MITASVLRIIELSLAITLELLKGMSEADKASLWKRHEERMEFWQGILKAVKIGD